MNPDSFKSPNQHHLADFVRSKLERHGFNWEQMTTVQVDVALKEIREREVSKVARKASKDP